MCGKERGDLSTIATVHREHPWSFMAVMGYLPTTILHCHFTMHSAWKNFFMPSKIEWILMIFFPPWTRSTYIIVAKGKKTLLQRLSRLKKSQYFTLKMIKKFPLDLAGWLVVNITLITQLCTKGSIWNLRLVQLGF